MGERNYGLFWIGHAGWNTGRWIELTGAVWLAYEISQSPILLGLLGIFRAVPAIVLSPIAGVIVDRLDQRKLLIIAQVVGLGASLTLGLLVLAGAVEMWHIYAQIAVQSAVVSFDWATRQALFPRLVPRRLLPEAVTLTSTAGTASQLIGPALGGLAIATLGEAAPFLINAAIFPGLLLTVIGMSHIPRADPVAGSTFRGELMEGLRHILASPLLSGLLKLEIVFGLFQLNPVLITIVGREVLRVGPEGLGGLLSAPALGAMVGIALLLAFGQARRQGRFVVVCLLGYSAILVAFAFSRNYQLTVLVLATAGLLETIETVTRHNVLQLAAPGRMRGRVMANMGTVVRGTTPLAQTQSGTLVGLVGPTFAVLAASGALAIAAGVTARRNMALWRFSRDGQSPGPADVAGEPVPPKPPAA